MQPSQVSIPFCHISQNPSSFSTNFNSMEKHMEELHLNPYSNPLCNFNIHPQAQEFNLQSPCFSNNSTSDEADQQHQHLINERKQRRTISNRESARRSRMRKQRHLDELLSQVVWLRNENHQLIDKLNQISESHDRVIQENDQLKGETSELRQLITDMQLKSPYSTLQNLENTELSP